MSRFAVIPARALTDPRMTDRHIRLLAALGLHTDRAGWCWPSLKTLGKYMANPGKHRTSVSAGRVSQLMKDLRAWGYVEVQERYREDGSRMSNAYRVLFDYDAPPGDGLEERDDFLDTSRPEYGQELPPDDLPPDDLPPGIKHPFSAWHRPHLAPGLKTPQPPGPERNVPINTPENVKRQKGVRVGEETPPFEKVEGTSGVRERELAGSGNGRGTPRPSSGRAAAALLAFGGLPLSIDGAEAGKDPTAAYKRRIAEALVDGAEAVVEDQVRRYRSWFPDESVWPLAEAFIRAFRPPTSRRAALGWLQPLREMQAAGVAPEEVEQAVTDMLRDDMTVKSPHQVVSRAVTLAVRRERGLKPTPRRYHRRAEAEAEGAKMPRIITPQEALRALDAVPPAKPLFEEEQ